MNRKFAIALALFSGMTFAHNVQAASFSCNAAKTKTELSICKNRSLNDADVKMATTYQIVLHALPMGGRDNQKDTQQQWLKKRNACAANVSCISKAYQQRQQQLDSILQDRVLSHGPF
ncbi:lysozyme inhibitor LprI family protein [Acinetobacter seifertii]|uniref:lysozyme inhibitor LprI family protein n=1 Tax=Acinetobacter seifertii TaxID=1530123 RepID=UPI001F06D533|nr:lysozyme inhibitor LprI family protein [Acinetobacter seifertii]MCH2002461.1 hypothetical protein [Acinetobacter seifertii]